MNAWLTLAVVAALAVVSLNADVASAPALIWGCANDYNQAHALHQYTGDELNQILQDERKPNAPTVVFHVPSLESIDLSKFKTSLPGLRSLTSLYLPNVAEPVISLQSAAAAATASSSIQTDDSAAPADLASTIASAQAGDYVFIGLTAAAHDEPRAETLRRHDALIHAIVANLAAQDKPALYVFTGQPTASHRIVRRQAPAPIETPAAKPVAPPADNNKQTTPAATNSSGIGFVDAHLLIHFANLTYDGAIINVAGIVVGEPVTVGDEQHISVQLTAVPPTDNLSFNVSGAHGYWEVDAFQFRGVTLRPFEFSVAALVDFSFHCSPSLNFQETTGAMSLLHLEGLQLEPIFEKAADGEEARTAFSDSWDCVGFTSAGIWGGIFVTVLMLIILSVGISWIMDIHTMDRFDDPKGKTIIVSAAE